MKTYPVLSALAAGLMIAPLASVRSAEPATAGPPAYSDTMLTYEYGTQYRTPGVVSESQPEGADIARNALEFTHVDGWAYGHNLVDLSLRGSSAVEPAAGGGSGAVELYAVLRSGLSVNRLAGNALVGWGPLKDIDLQVGADIQTKNTAYAPAERTVYLGPNFEFSFSAGSVTLGLHARKEWNHNGVLGVAERYAVDFNVEPQWNLHFGLAGQQFSFVGFADYNTPKGPDSFGNPTHAELIVQPQLMLQVGNLLHTRASNVEVGIGAVYWNNMYGKDASRVPGAKEFAPMLALTVHL